MPNALPELTSKMAKSTFTITFLRNFDFLVRRKPEAHKQNPARWAQITHQQTTNSTQRRRTLNNEQPEGQHETPETEQITNTNTNTNHEQKGICQHTKTLNSSNCGRENHHGKERKNLLVGWRVQSSYLLDKNYHQTIILP